jgi:Ca-activated chloride channel family protein
MERMLRLGRIFALWVLGWLAGPMACAQILRVENRTGNVVVHSAAGDGLHVRRSSPTRQTEVGDTTFTETPQLLVLRCEPGDGARVDLDIVVPYGIELEIATVSGSISFTGFVRHLTVNTERGDIRLAVPWTGMRLDIAAAQKPGGLSVPRGTRFSFDSNEGIWTLGKGSEGEVTFGFIQVLASAPRRIELIDIPVPDDSPVRFPWQAPAVLNALLRRPAMATPAAGRPGYSTTLIREDAPLFVSDVRMVNLAVAAYDRQGRPVLDLKPEDLEVREDGVPQKVAVTASEKVPFNLALLLDLSGSTLRDRAAIKEAARRFVEITRPHDRIATYAMADNLFYIVSPLSNDRQELLNLIEKLPDVSGETPLYASIAMSYAEEFARNPRERSALIVISDGLDSTLGRIETRYGFPPLFERLRRVASGAPMLVYPVFLEAREYSFSRRARKLMQTLADVTGGRLFPARSIRDLDPVYAQVAEELSSVCSVAYYPRNQNFDGRWRRVQVKVKRPGVTLRTRAGYYAR